MFKEFIYPGVRTRRVIFLKAPDLLPAIENANCFQIKVVVNHICFIFVRENV